MRYVKVTGDTISEVPSGNIEWDENHFCAAERLSPEELLAFNVFECEYLDEPEFDSTTHTAVRNPPAWDGSKYVVTWSVIPLSEIEIAKIQANIAGAARAKAKQMRQTLVDKIQVTTQSGKTFDGDETSQNRMARAILALQATGTPTVTWVLADNTSTQATVAELSEALALAGATQAAIWVI